MKGYIKGFSQFLTESSSDALKLKYAIRVHVAFVNRCKRKFKEVINAMFSEGYYTYKVNDLTVSITLDDLSNESGDSAVGQYSDETRELIITVFPILRKIRYGAGYIGLGQIDELAEITADELQIYVGIVRDALTNTGSKEFEKIKDVFIHELVHHWDNVNYGAGYTEHVEGLESTRHAIEDRLERDNFYFGMPHEINARFVQALSAVLDNHGSGFGDYRTFQEMFLQYFINYSALSQPIKNKIKKRLFYFFENDLQDFN